MDWMKDLLATGRTPLRPLLGDLFVKNENGDFVSMPNTLESLQRTDYYVYGYGHFIPGHIANSMWIDISEGAKPIEEQIADILRRLGHD